MAYRTLCQCGIELTVADPYTKSKHRAMGHRVRAWNECPRCGRTLELRLAQTMLHFPPHNCKGEVLGENQMYRKLSLEETARA